MFVGRNLEDLVVWQDIKNTHTGNNPYECDIDVCEKKFVRLDYLASHRRTHTITGDKRYECDVCKKKFRRPSSLGRHKRTHRGKQTFWMWCL
jgi:uncharacterized Zn-finger protein